MPLGNQCGSTACRSQIGPVTTVEFAGRHEGLKSPDPVDFVDVAVVKIGGYDAVGQAEEKPGAQPAAQRARCYWCQLQPREGRERWASGCGRPPPPHTGNRQSRRCQSGNRSARLHGPVALGAGHRRQDRRDCRVVLANNLLVMQPCAVRIVRRPCGSPEAVGSSLTIIGAQLTDRSAEDASTRLDAVISVRV